MQAGAERALNRLMTALAGASVLFGQGMLETGLTFDIPTLLVDDEIIDYVLRMLAGFKVDATTLSTDLIKEVGPFGTYLAEMNTFEHLGDLSTYNLMTVSYTHLDVYKRQPPAKYIEAAAKHNADIIACSALLTTTMVHIKDVVKGVAESPLAGKVKIMIGGAPVNDAFRESIGADYYTPDASSAAEKALEICAAARA